VRTIILIAVILTAVVSVHQNNTWKIAVAEYRRGRWSALKNISSGGPDLFPRVAVAAGGNVWVVWQGFRDGRSRILASRFNGNNSSQ
jgi:hypothetical protein